MNYFFTKWSNFIHQFLDYIVCILSAWRLIVHILNILFFDIIMLQISFRYI